jgi:hypothetical protein
MNSPLMKREIAPHQPSNKVEARSAVSWRRVRSTHRRPDVVGLRLRTIMPTWWRLVITVAGLAPQT